MADSAALVGEGISSFWLSLCLTYMAHAIVWAAVAALGARSRRLSFAARHDCWKAALFGPLLSASLASAWSGAQGAATPEDALDRASASAQIVSRAAADASHSWLPQVELSLRPAMPSAAGLARLTLAAGGFGLLRFAVGAAALRRRLHSRRRVTDPRLVQRFEALLSRMGLRQVCFTECDRVPSPLVIGGREVCVPVDVLSLLSDEDLDAVLAHELAHIERGDGVWFPLVGAIQYTLWFQPLNHLVSSHFRSSAEDSCDDRAVELTQNPKALGRAILSLAEAAARMPGPALAPSIVRHESDLGRRVRRLAVASPRADVLTQRGYWSAVLAVAFVGAALVTLSVRVVRAQRVTTPSTQSSRGASKANPAKAAPKSSDALEPHDLAEHGSRMAELSAQDQRLTLALAELSNNPAASREGTAEFTRELELEQQLRHVRATQAWLEQRFVATWSPSDPR